MPSQTYILDPENPKRLEIISSAFWRSTAIRLDGQEIGTVASKRELVQGQDLKLPDGSKLKVRLIQSLMGSELHILRDGKPIPGSASHPETLIRSAYWALFLLSTISVLFGVVARMLHVDMLGEMGISDYSIGIGIILFGLAFLVRRHSLLALYAGIGLFAADTILGLVLASASGGAPNTFNLIFRGLLFFPLVQGVGALRSLKESERASG